VKKWISLATIDDVILYLRQSGEVFAENESADELLVRANLKRMDQGLPPFALLSAAPAKDMPRDKPQKVSLVLPLREKGLSGHGVLSL
jgi:hypothetical protein